MPTNQMAGIPMTPEERLDALAEAFAESFLSFAEQGLLSEFQDYASPEAGSDTP